MAEIMVILVLIFVFGFVIYNLVKHKSSTPTSSDGGTSGGGGGSSYDGTDGRDVKNRFPEQQQ